jgi:hypothetical protein
MGKDQVGAPLEHRAFHYQVPLLRRIVTEHATDDVRQRLAEKVVAHLELSGFEIDEQQRVIRKRDGGRGW